MFGRKKQNEAGQTEPQTKPQADAFICLCRVRRVLPSSSRCTQPVSGMVRTVQV